jgi:hypothetical protein
MSEEEAKYGIDWTGGELDLIVADYFVMLADELAGRPYAKAGHNAALRERIPRGRGSVEFKYQDVSAVLEKLGMPWIPGYKPARHYQGAIAGAISRYLVRAPEALDVPAPLPQVPTTGERLRSTAAPNRTTGANAGGFAEADREIRSCGARSPQPQARPGRAASIFPQDPLDRRRGGRRRRL